jgi:DNA-binding transcriptional ArsR family regulator
MRGFAALSDPTRQRIVEMLASGPLCAGDIARRFAISPPAVSQHLKALREARIVRVRGEAQRRIYELDAEGLLELWSWLDRIRLFWSKRLDRLEDALIAAARADKGEER